MKFVDEKMNVVDEEKIEDRGDRIRAWGCLVDNFVDSFMPTQWL
jgi:hypothetical protein